MVEDIARILHYSYLHSHRERMVIRYVGTPQCLVPAPHGNSISNKPFIRTNPSVIASLKNVAAKTGAHAGPSNMYKEAVVAGVTEDVREYPRDMKQVTTVHSDFINYWVMCLFSSFSKFY